MFRSPAERWRSWRRRVEDFLGDGPPPAPPPHPHRFALRWERTRRPGSVPARPAHCITPIRSRSGAGRRERVDTLK